MESPRSSGLTQVGDSVVLCITHGTAEAMALAEGLGVDPDRFFEALDAGPMDVPYLHIKAAAILNRDFTPNFMVDGAWKDAKLILAAGERAGIRLDVVAAGAERFRRAVALGHGREDMAASYFASFDGDPQE